MAECAMLWLGPELTPVVDHKTCIQREALSPGSGVISPPMSLCRIQAWDVQRDTDALSPRFPTLAPLASFALAITASLCSREKPL